MCNGLVRPPRIYAAQVWEPHLKKDIANLEYLYSKGVQNNGTIATMTYWIKLVCQA